MFNIPKEILEQIELNRVERTKLEASNIEKKYELVNWLGLNFNYNSYLEISCYSSGHFFNKVKEDIFIKKHCLNYKVDEIRIKPDSPKTLVGDHDFDLVDYNEGFEQINDKYDVVFLDSFHSFEQSLKDLYTAMDLVSEGGAIVVHDCNPPSESLVGNSYVDGKWCGQTFESFIHFRHENPEIETVVLDLDLGCAVIRPNFPAFNSLSSSKPLKELTTWEYFSEHRKELLNLMSFQDYKNHLFPESN